MYDENEIVNSPKLLLINRLKECRVYDELLNFADYKCAFYKIVVSPPKGARKKTIAHATTFPGPAATQDLDYYFIPIQSNSFSLLLYYETRTIISYITEKPFLPFRLKLSLLQ